MAKKSKKNQAAAAPAAPAAPAPPPPPAAPAVPTAQPATAPMPVAGAPVPAPPPPPVPGAVPAAPTPAAPAAEKAPRATAPKQNGVAKPSEGTQTRAVWDRADAITASTGAPAKRKQVVDECAAAGINTSTATTQFGRWCKFNGYTAERAPGRAATPATPSVATHAPAPVAAAPAPGVSAFDQGKNAFAEAMAGRTPSNPFSAGTAEADQFAQGWTAAQGAYQQPASA